MLEYRTKADGTRYPVLVACPACGMGLLTGLSRRAHLERHTPDDFGL